MQQPSPSSPEPVLAQELKEIESDMPSRNPVELSEKIFTPDVDTLSIYEDMITRDVALSKLARSDQNHIEEGAGLVNDALRWGAWDFAQDLIGILKFKSTIRRSSDGFERKMQTTQTVDLRKAMMTSAEKGRTMFGMGKKEGEQ